MSGGRKKRTIKVSKKVPAIDSLYEEAYKRGITMFEYVNYLSTLNLDPKENRKGRTTRKDLGPIIHRDIKE